MFRIVCTIIVKKITLELPLEKSQYRSKGQFTIVLGLGLTPKNAPFLRFRSILFINSTRVDLFIYYLNEFCFLAGMIDGFFTFCSKIQILIFFNHQILLNYHGNRLKLLVLCLSWSSKLIFCSKTRALQSDLLAISFIRINFIMHIF